MSTEPRVHPVAALFPMMSDDELAELAEDIKANGLLHPIIRDQEGQLIDGRNRERACQMAGVQPRHETLNGHDPVAFILGANIHRRHLTTGQRAMAVAMALQSYESVKAPLGAKAQAARAARLTQVRVSEALAILEWARDEADGVLGGSRAFDSALKIARERRDAASSLEAQFARLQAAAPDLAALVTEERVSLSDAVAAFEKRERDAALARRTTTQLYAGAVAFLTPGPEWTAETKATSIAPLLQPSQREDVAFTAEEARGAAAVLLRIAAQLEEGEGQDG